MELNTAVSNSAVGIVFSLHCVSQFPFREEDVGENILRVFAANADPGSADLAVLIVSNTIGANILGIAQLLGTHAVVKGSSSALCKTFSHEVAHLLGVDHEEAHYFDGKRTIMA